MKFAELKYNHLDYEKLREEFEEKLGRLKNAKGLKEYLDVFKEINVFRGHISSMKELCSIRHTINTVDEYYDRENQYWDETMPRLQKYEVEFGKILLRSPYRKYAGSPESLYKTFENTLKSFDEAIIEDLQKENILISEYGKLKASARIEF